MMQEELFEKLDKNGSCQNQGMSRRHFCRLAAPYPSANRKILKIPMPIIKKPYFECPSL